ncbi:endoribonuclease YBEY, chloroplastic isoform X2 [Cryptomeria japonica]|uniref:endoribonuclease YBEY, chloroplastic isoform X2 n=1 Tax=Cryptomeria japonica TaxID=3369 RepID=UPI0027DA8024|nr:endoribonuclease YBEY, chloroplastic isoform X2 [Cryptomeria japonica]
MVSCRCSFLLRSAPSFRGAFMDTICKCSWRFMGRGMGATISISTWSPTIHIPSFSAMPISIHLPPIMSNTLHHQPCCPRPEGTRFMASLPVVRWFRRMRRSALKRPPAEKELDLDIRIAFAENVYKDEELLNIAELLHLNVPMAMKVAFDGIKDSTAKTRDTAIEDVGSFEKVELSVLLCDNDFIRELNKEWRDMDCTTDVISMSQHIPGCQLPVLKLGDIAISVDAAAKQAVERGHSLLDEIRILMVHGMLHLLGYNNERSKEAQKEMEKEKDIILKCLGWKGIGSMHITNESLEDCRLPHKSEKENFDGWADQDIKTEKEKIMRSYKPKFKYLFCDMDGTLLNSKSLVSPRTAEALREANSRGVKIIIATGKARPAAMSALQLVDLAGEDGIISKSSPGVFLQGLLVYGKQGLELHRRNLDPDICKEAFLFSLEQQFPLVGFSEDRMVTLFNHPLIDALHSVYFEPKAEVMSSVEHLLSSVSVQKLLFYDTAENVHNVLRPHWSVATEGQARVVQALPDMLEILPSGASKGAGVQMLLDHLGVNSDEVMAIGDGENDVEMLDLVGWGVVMANGSDKAKAVANAIVTSNDEDGVADAIYRYVF